MGVGDRDSRHGVAGSRGFFCDGGGDLFEFEVILLLGLELVGGDGRDHLGVHVHRDNEEDHPDQNHHENGDDEAGDGGGPALGFQSGLGFG